MGAPEQLELHFRQPNWRHYEPSELEYQYFFTLQKAKELGFTQRLKWTYKKRILILLSYIENISSPVRTEFIEEGEKID